MASTGEVACFGEDVEEAYLKAMIATGYKVPQKGIFISLRGDDKHAAFAESLPHLQALDLPLYATEDTWHFLRQRGMTATLLHHPGEQVEPTAEDSFRNQQIDLAIIIVAGRLHTDFDAYYIMRRLAVDCNIPLITKIKQARLFLRALAHKDLATIPIKAWDEYQVVEQQSGERSSSLVACDKSG
jgi:carbamoyl-phosphate synthase large subunit